ncbi:hypothetical protein BH20CHL3_BH20CHL3_03750 [soil metagenome]
MTDDTLGVFGMRSSPHAERRVRGVEHDLRTPPKWRRREHVTLIDNLSGSVGWHFEGDEGRVVIPVAKWPDLPGNVPTHNHPAGWRFPVDDPRHAGSSFAIDDVALIAHVGLVELRAVSPRYTHILRQSPDLGDLRGQLPRWTTDHREVSLESSTTTIARGGASIVMDGIQVSWC